MNSLIWFRRDLRVTDNTALYHAAHETRGGVVGLFVITPQQWLAHDDAGCKVKFWLDNLDSLSAALAKLGIPLRIASCDSFAEVPGKIVEIAKKHQCESVYLNREYEVNERRRDDQVAMECTSADISVQRFHDRVIVPPRKVMTKEGKFYSVFTPFRRVWDKQALNYLRMFPKPKRQRELKFKTSKIPTKIPGFDLSSVHDKGWPSGEAQAQQRLKKFSRRFDDYHDARNIPSDSGTSMLSAYLAAGVISPRQCLTAAMAANDGTIGGESGAATWINELTWRDFYIHVLAANPRVSMHQPFKQYTDNLDWRTDEAEFEAWKQGQTGYPMVDAGMRQLNQTGWMHNRLRMVTAMFLTKHLLIDWRWGERYFMKTLIDGDLAANNGGWQWSASTGTDSVPYFRIFNPFSQSKRFDPEATFIKKMCPELAEVPPSSIHDPKKLTAAIQKLNLNYPEFVVDYSAGRTRALAAFKSLSR